MPESADLKAAQAPFFWGVDIGGTGIKCGLVDSGGKTVAYEYVPTYEPQGPQAAVDRLAKLIEETEQRLGVTGKVPRIGIGAPGPIDLERGYLVGPPQLPSWWNFPLVEAMRSTTGREVSFLNDANAAAYGEFWLGSGQEEQSMILLTLGTGVGGGIIIDDQLVNGVNSFGSECGHILLDPSPEAQLCRWGGGRGHLEAYASATGVVMRTHQQLPDHPESALQRFAMPADDGSQSAGSECDTKPSDRLTSKRVYEAAVAGDPFALEMVDQTARWLGIGITSLVHTLDPGSVVLGGAMNFGGAECPVGHRFLEGIREEFRQRTFPNVFAGTTLSYATLGSDAGYLGAAGYARKQAGV